jgi:hypothetical protein
MGDKEVCIIGAGNSGSSFDSKTTVPQLKVSDFGHLDLFRNSDFVLRIYILSLDP